MLCGEREQGVFEWMSFLVLLGVTYVNVHSPGVVALCWYEIAPKKLFYDRFRRGGLGWVWAAGFVREIAAMEKTTAVGQHHDVAELLEEKDAAAGSAILTGGGSKDVFGEDSATEEQTITPWSRMIARCLLACSWARSSFFWIQENKPNREKRRGGKKQHSLWMCVMNFVFCGFMLGWAYLFDFFLSFFLSMRVVVVFSLSLAVQLTVLYMNVC